MEYSLWGSTSDSQCSRTLRLLSAATGMQPIGYRECTLAYARSQSSLHVKLVTGIEGDAYEEGRGWLEGQQWRVMVEDIPEAGGNRPVTSRLSIASAVREGNAMQFLEMMGYVAAFQYFTQGFRFVHNDVVILVFKVSRPNALYGKEVGTVGSGWIVHAAVKVRNATDAESSRKAMDQLRVLKNELRDVIELKEANRSSLDTRYKR